MITLRKISETASRITLGWDPVPGAIGYRFQSAANAPKWSHTWDGTRTDVVFPKGAEPYRVEALGMEDSGVWPTAEPPPPPGLPFAEAQLRPGFVTVTASDVFSALGGLSGTNVYYNLPSGPDVLIDMQWQKWNRSLKIGVRNGQRCHVKNVYIDVTIPVNSGNVYSRAGLNFRPLALSDAPGHCSATGVLITGTTLADGMPLGQTSASVQGGPFTYQMARVESRSSRLGRAVVYPSADELQPEHYDCWQAQGPGSPIQFGNCTFMQCDMSGIDGGKGLMINSYLSHTEQYFLTNVNFRDDNAYNNTGTGAAWFKDYATQTITLNNVWAIKYGTGSGVWGFSDGRLFYNTATKNGTKIAYTVTGTAPNRVASFPNNDGVSGEVREGRSPDGEDFCTRADLIAMGLIV